MIRNFFECFKPLDRAEKLDAVGNIYLPESDVALELTDITFKLDTVVVDIAA